jgi:putative nucleotidyltransferase with HDIG domain
MSARSRGRHRRKAEVAIVAAGNKGTLVVVDTLCAKIQALAPVGTNGALVREWVVAMESSDNDTFGHGERVAANAVAIARALGLGEQEQFAIRLGAYLHDVGKVKVPREILNKPGPLTSDEVVVVQMHPAWGAELASEAGFPRDITPIIRSHHEHFDGGGYPDGLCGDEIPVSAQIVGIADVYDALTSTRTYRSALSPADALVTITTCRSWWSLPVLEATLRALSGGPARLTS